MPAQTHLSPVPMALHGNGVDEPDMYGSSNEGSEAGDIQLRQQSSALMEISATEIENKKKLRNNTPFADQLTSIVPTANQPSSTLRRFLYNLFCTNRYAVVWTCLWLLLHLIDYGSDIYAAWYYYQQQRVYFALLTITFVALPSVLSMFHCLIWFYRDGKREHGKSCLMRTLELLLILVQMGPVLSFVDLIRHQYKYQSPTSPTPAPPIRQQIAATERQMRWLYMVEAGLESGPQLCLQLHILLETRTPSTLLHYNAGQMTSLLTSLVSLAMYFVSYSAELRYSLNPELYSDATGDWRDPVGQVLQFGWHWCVIGARVTALVLFAADHFYWALGIALTHVLLMTVWMVGEIGGNEATSKSDLFTATAFLFDFLDNKPLWTRRGGRLPAVCCGVQSERAAHVVSYAFYYGLHYAENVAMIGVWFAGQVVVGRIAIAALCVAVCGTPVGLLCFMVPYYLFCHKPKRWRQRVVEKHAQEVDADNAAYDLGLKGRYARVLS